jgi:hypothetical protein
MVQDRRWNSYGFDTITSANATSVADYLSPIF